jgi:methionyl aminopeptidase
MAIHLKGGDELKLMREAGRIVARCHEAMREAVRPGINTLELNQIAERVLAQHDARAAFLGYPYGSENPFPAAITASINDEIVHGIPSADRILREGDLLSLDIGVIYKGYIGDAAFSIGVGEISTEVAHLLEVTEASLYEGIRASVSGNSIRDVALAVQTFVEAKGYNVVRDYSGHGVGRKLHEDPSVPNWWPRRRQRAWKPIPLKAGMTYAIEPMVCAGSAETRERDDHWTVVTADGSLCAHFEHTIAVQEDEPWVLTVL